MKVALYECENCGALRNVSEREEPPYGDAPLCRKCHSRMYPVATTSKEIKEMNETIELGDRVQDRISKIKGIVIGKTEWLYGCKSVTIQPEEAKDGKPAEVYSLDEPQCILLEKAVIKREKVGKAQKEDPGGPQPEIDRGHEVAK